MAVGGETRLGTTASDWRAREGGETGDKRPVMILTPRWSFCGGLRRQRSGGAAERRAAGAWRRQRRKSSGGFGFSGEDGGCGLGKI
jgi:hypothetical protein